MTPPGGYAPLKDVWGEFSSLTRMLPAGALVVVDARVAALHPQVLRAVRRCHPAVVLLLTAGENAKSLPVLARVLQAGARVSRSAPLLAVGGGTLGDLCTVAAHLIKRGLALIHVPTTLLAAVDSSVGGKGAVHVAVGKWTVKNGAGVFHYPRETWLCPELWQTLEAAQHREGAIEAWKMAACLDAARWRKYRAHRPGVIATIRDARKTKDRVCRGDPYEVKGPRRVLNFGHTFGHVLESLTRFRLSHGDAVGLGMLCALDVGRALSVTSEELAREVEEGLEQGPGILGRRALARALRGTRQEIASLLAADKKSGAQVNMVLLRGLGRAEVRPVPERVWRRLLTAWRRGTRP